MITIALIHKEVSKLDQIVTIQHVAINSQELIRSKNWLIIVVVQDLLFVWLQL
jgi:hypothetical protein